MAEAPKALVIDEVLQGSIDAVKSTEERYRLAQEEAAISDSDRPVYFDPEIRALELALMRLGQRVYELVSKTEGEN